MNDLDAAKDLTSTLDLTEDLGGLPEETVAAATAPRGAPDVQAAPSTASVEYFGSDRRITPSADDANLLVRFFFKEVPNRNRNPQIPESMKLPEFVEREYVSITVAGSREPRVSPVTPRDIQRFPNHYKAFKTRTALPEHGTPLRDWPAIPASLVDTLTFVNVKTVEQLANMSDTHKQEIRGVVKYCNLAREYLADREKMAGYDELKASNTELEQQVRDLNAKLDALLQRSEPLPQTERAQEAGPLPDKPRQRGRPRKAD